MVYFRVQKKNKKIFLKKLIFKGGEGTFFDFSKFKCSHFQIFRHTHENVYFLSHKKKRKKNWKKSWFWVREGIFSQETRQFEKIPSVENLEISCSIAMKKNPIQLTAECGMVMVLRSKIDLFGNQKQSETYFSVK